MASFLVVTCQRDGDKVTAELKENDKTLAKFSSSALNIEWGPDAEEPLLGTVNYEVLSPLSVTNGFMAIWLNMLCTASFPDELLAYWDDKDCRGFRESIEIAKDKRTIKYTPVGFESESKYIDEKGFNTLANIDQKLIDDILSEMDIEDSEGDGESSESDEEPKKSSGESSEGTKSDT